MCSLVKPVHQAMMSDPVLTSLPGHKYRIVRRFRHYQPSIKVNLNSSQAVNVHKLLTNRLSLPGLLVIASLYPSTNIVGRFITHSGFRPTPPPPSTPPQSNDDTGLPLWIVGPLVCDQCGVQILNSHRFETLPAC